jgi:hypothetical protein
MLKFRQPKFLTPDRVRVPTFPNDFPRTFAHRLPCYLLLNTLPPPLPSRASRIDSAYKKPVWPRRIGKTGKIRAIVPSCRHAGCTQRPQACSLASTGSEKPSVSPRRLSGKIHTLPRQIYLGHTMAPVKIFRGHPLKSLCPRRGRIWVESPSQEAESGISARQTDLSTGGKGNFQAGTSALQAKAGGSLWLHSQRSDEYESSQSSALFDS